MIREMVINRIEFMKLLEEFYLAVLSFGMKFLEEAKLPVYKGSTLRLVLGRGLKKASCISKARECEECSYKFSCIYFKFFETPISSYETFGKLTNGSHSFMIEPPLDNRNETLTSRGRQVFSSLKLEKADSGKLFNKFVRGKDFRNITFKFVTPTRIKYRNKLTDTLPFYIMAKNLIKRVEMLRYFYGKKTALFANYKDLINLSQDVRGESSQLYWYDWERYSSRQKVRVKLGGLKGTITYSGDIENFPPLLFLGSYIYIGKGTSLGLGKYEILQEEV